MILLDTNVLLDVVLEREPHAAASTALLDAIERTREPTCVAWHALATVYYFATRERDHSAAVGFIRQLLSSMEVPATGSESMRVALDQSMSDFEDAMQVAAAIECQADYIVTRDRDDFGNAPIPAISPQAALERLF